LAVHSSQTATTRLLAWALDEKQKDGIKMPATRRTSPETPPHPGKILQFEMKSAGIDVIKLATALSVPVTYVAQIVNGDRDITPDMAMRLHRCLGIPAGEWLRLQNSHGLARVEQAVIERDVVPLLLRRKRRASDITKG
jgi:antitoxin HigA-1